MKLLIFFTCRAKTKKKTEKKNANDSNRVMFTQPSSPDDYSHCSNEPSNDSRQPNIEIQAGLVTRLSLNANAKIYTQI